MLDFSVVGIDHVVIALVGLLLTGTARLLLGACLSLLSLSSLLVELFADLLSGGHQRFHALFNRSLVLALDAFFHILDGVFAGSAISAFDLVAEILQGLLNLSD